MAKKEHDCADAVLAAWRSERPDLDVGALAVTYRLLRAGRLLQARLDHISAGHGFSHKGDLDVLTALVRCGPPHEMTPSGLAELVLMTTGGMTARLDRLEKAGLLTRRPSRADRREMIVTLTEEGYKVADRAFRDVLEAQSVVVAPLSQSATTSAIDILKKLLIELEK